MTKIYDDPNMRRGNPDNEEMRTTVIDASSDLPQWEEIAIDRTTLKSELPLRHVNREKIVRAPLNP